MRLLHWKWCGIVLCFFDPMSVVGQKSNMTETVFSVVEHPPQFKGGKDSLTYFLQKHFANPEAAKSANVNCKVMVKFIVEPTGQLSDIELAWSAGHGCDEESLRVVKLFPPWEPGRQSGKAVRVRVHLTLKYPFQ